MLRTRPLFVSPTNTQPLAESTATTLRPLNNAAVPVPSTEPLAMPVAPPPASVVTTAAAEMRRTLLFPVSATYRVDDASAAKLYGFRNSALVPLPSMEPATAPDALPPTNTVSVEPDSCRMLWFSRLHTKLTPVLSTMTAVGQLSSPPLTTVETVPSGSTRRMRLSFCCAMYPTPDASNEMLTGV